MADIGGEDGYWAAVSILNYALTELTGFFNVGKNMSVQQITKTAEVLIARYPHFSFADFKVCFTNAMMTAKLFDRLDGNIICGWLDDYGKERDAALLRYYEQQDKEQYQSDAQSEEGKSFDEYIASVRRRAEEGDKDAIEELERAEQYLQLKSGRSDPHAEKLAFRRAYLQYLNSKRQSRNISQNVANCDM